MKILAHYDKAFGRVLYVECPTDLPVIVKELQKKFSASELVRMVGGESASEVVRKRILRTRVQLSPQLSNLLKAAALPQNDSSAAAKDSCEAMVEDSPSRTTPSSSTTLGTDSKGATGAEQKIQEEEVGLLYSHHIFKCSRLWNILLTAEGIHPTGPCPLCSFLGFQFDPNVHPVVRYLPTSGDKEELDIFLPIFRCTTSSCDVHSNKYKAACLSCSKGILAINCMVMCQTDSAWRLVPPRVPPLAGAHTPKGSKVVYTPWCPEVAKEEDVDALRAVMERRGQDLSKLESSEVDLDLPGFLCVSCGNSLSNILSARCMTCSTDGVQTLCTVISGSCCKACGKCKVEYLSPPGENTISTSGTKEELTAGESKTHKDCEPEAEADTTPKCLVSDRFVQYALGSEKQLLRSIGVCTVGDLEICRLDIGLKEILVMASLMNLPKRQGILTGALSSHLVSPSENMNEADGDWDVTPLPESGVANASSSKKVDNRVDMCADPSVGPLPCEDSFMKRSSQRRSTRFSMEIGSLKLCKGLWNQQDFQGTVSCKLSESCLLVLHLGDITKWSVDGQRDAIVNAANKTMLGGGGVDGAIHRAAGSDLLRMCRAVPEVTRGVRCPTSHAITTGAAKLPVSLVIHTVGPVHGTDQQPKVLLQNAYRNCLVEARVHGVKFVAFPAISCGIYGYPVHEAAMDVVSVLPRICEGLQEIHFVLFGRQEMDLWLTASNMYLCA